MTDEISKEIEQEPLGKLFFCLFVFVVIIWLLLQNELEVTIYPVCILFTLLLVIIVSGKIEINLGNIIKIRKDTEEIKKDLTDLKIITSNIQFQHQDNKQDVKVVIQPPGQPYTEGIYNLENPPTYTIKQ